MSRPSPSAWMQASASRAVVIIPETIPDAGSVPAPASRQVKSTPMEQHRDAALTALPPGDCLPGPRPVLAAGSRSTIRGTDFARGDGVVRLAFALLWLASVAGAQGS